MAMIFIQGRAIMVNNDASNGIQMIEGEGWVIKATITAPTPEETPSGETSHVFVG